MSDIKNGQYLNDNPDLEGFNGDPVLAEWECEYISPILSAFKPKEHYTLFKNRIRIVSGRMSQYTEEIQFKKIEQIAMRTSFFGRIFNTGDVIITTKIKKLDTVLHVKNPEEVMAIINQALYDEKQAYLRSKGKGENHYSHRNNRGNDKKIYRNSSDKKGKGKNGENELNGLDVIRNVAP